MRIKKLNILIQISRFNWFNFSGYYGDPEKYAETVKDGWIHSGDWGYFDDEGFLFVVDRVKHMLKTKVIFPPVEIEKLINEVEGVNSSAVVGVDDGGSDIIYAFVVKDPSINVDEEKILNYVNSHLVEKKKITGGVKFVENFPVTFSGKIRKLVLKENAKKMLESSQSAPSRRFRSD